MGRPRTPSPEGRRALASAAPPCCYVHGRPMALEVRVRHRDPRDIPAATCGTWLLDGASTAPFLSHAWPDDAGDDRLRGRRHRLDAPTTSTVVLGGNGRHGVRASSPPRPRTSRATARASSCSIGGRGRAARRAGIRSYCPKLIVAVPFTPATGTRLLVAAAAG